MVLMRCAEALAVVSSRPNEPERESARAPQYTYSLVALELAYDLASRNVPYEGLSVAATRCKLAVVVHAVECSFEARRTSRESVANCARVCGV